MKCKRFVISVVIILTYVCICLCDLPTDRPLNIAHRGSSGMLPEHTVEAYQLAIDQGADVIECDLAVTKDLKLICSHEPWLNHSTNVNSHLEFADRVRTYRIGGSLRRDYFTIDFTLEELKTLRKVQSRSYRDQSHNLEFSMATFDEYIAVAQNLSNPKTIAIYPETKIPIFFNDFLEPNETNFEDLLLESLVKHGYSDSSDPCFLQSFDIRSLQYLSNRTDLKLVYLSSAFITDDQMEKYSSYIHGLGTSKDMIVQVNPVNNKIMAISNFLERAHNNGFVVHPYTFRNEYQFLAYDYGADPYQEYEKFLELGTDGFFTDFPGSLSKYLDVKFAEEIEPPTCAGVNTKATYFTLLFQFLTLFMYSYHC